MTRFKPLMALGLLAVAWTSNAVTLDGIMTADDGYDTAFTITWHNDHNADDSAYSFDMDLTTTAYATSSGGTFYVYIAVPLYAKNMMWGSALAADQDELDAYFYNNTHYHHSLDKVNDKLKYGTMVGSERIEWGSNKVDLDLSSDDGDWHDVRTSLDWVLSNGCDTESCDRKDVPMAFEFQYTGSDLDMLSLIASLQSESVVFHLSDERQGEVTYAPVPLPASVWLFASGLLGLLRVSRRKGQ